MMYLAHDGCEVTDFARRAGALSNLAREAIKGRQIRKALSMDDYERTVSADRLTDITRLAADVAPQLLHRGVPFDVTLPEVGPLGWYLRAYRMMRGTEREGQTTWEWTRISVLGQDGVLYTARREDEMQTFTTYQVGRDELLDLGRLDTIGAVLSLERDRSHHESRCECTEFGRTLLDDLHQLATVRTTQPRHSMIPRPKPAPDPVPSPRFGYGRALLVILGTLVLAAAIVVFTPLVPLAPVVLVAGFWYAIFGGKRSRGPR
ncbi:hypothetical protein ACWDOP_02635 [Nocardia sp. NPDC003693]